MSQQEPGRRRKRTGAVWLAVVLAVAGAGCLAALSQGPVKSGLTPVEQAALAKVEVARNTMGRAAATVELVEYGDYL